MRIDDDLEVSASSAPAMPAGTEVDATARKVNTTLMEMFEHSLNRKDAQVDLKTSVINYLQLMGKMATDKRKDIEKEKRTYSETNQLSAGLIRNIARDRLFGAAGASACAILGIGPTPLYQIAGKQLSESIVPGFTGMWTAGQEANKARADSTGALALQELNNQTSQSQSDANSKEAVARLIAEDGEAKKRAAQNT